jgi:hypothetical protein
LSDVFDVDESLDFDDESPDFDDESLDFDKESPDVDVVAVDALDSLAAVPLLLPASDEDFLA